MIPLSPDHPEFILASGSPRRRELTANLGFDPIVIASRVPEERGPEEAPSDYALRLAREKAAEVAARHAGRADLPDLVLAADTIVVLGEEVLEKPADRADAERMLGALSGRAHEVVTAFCWRSRSTGQERARAVRAVVHLRELDADTIARYVATGDPMDKAGGYGIQGVAGAFVDRIEGSYTCIVGLPVAAVVAELEGMGGLIGFPWVAGGIG